MYIHILVGIILFFFFFFFFKDNDVPSPLSTKSYLASDPIILFNWREHTHGSSRCIKRSTRSMTSSGQVALWMIINILNDRHVDIPDTALAVTILLSKQ